MDVAKLQVIIATKGVAEAQKELDKLTKSANNTEKSAKSLSSSFSGIGLAVVAGLAYKATTEFIKTADTMKLLEARIKLVSGATEVYAENQKQLISIANENRTSFSGVAQLYAKMKPDLEKMGASTQTVMKITDAFSKSLLIGGASAQESSSAILQFSQAMASGRLQGDEYRSMIENNPRFMRLLREELGKTSAEIKKMATDGTLTADVLSGALLNGFAKLKDEVKTIPTVVGGALEVLKNTTNTTVESLDKMTGASSFVVKGIEGLTGAMAKAPEYFSTFDKNIDTFILKHQNSYKVVKALSDLILGIADVGVTVVDESASLASKSLSGFAKWVDVLSEPFIRNLEDVRKLKEDLDKTFKKPIEILVVPKSGAEDYKELVKKRLDVAKAFGDSERELRDTQNMAFFASEGVRKEKEAKEEEKRIKEEEKLRKKAEDDAIRLSEEWAVKKREISASMAIAEQDELAKPFILLEQKYQENLIKYASQNGAKLRLTEEFNAELERLGKDVAKKTEEDYQKEQEKIRAKNEQTIQKELKLQEENFRIQERQVALLEDEADREVAVATLQYQRTQASLMAQLKIGNVSQDYYDNMMSAEEKLLNKQKESWTVYGQIIKNTTAGMESSFLNFFDSTNQGYMDMGSLAKSILKEMYIEAVRVAMVKPLVGGLTSGLMSAGSYFFGGGASAMTLPDASTSTAFTGSEPLQFAHGGTPTGLSSYANQIVSKPTYFAFANGGVPNGGLMGEAGSEAIMPLTRTSNGDLGVSMVGGGGSNVTINIENQTGMNIDLKQLTKSQDDKGNEIRTYVMKFASSDPEFRTALGLSR